MMDKQKQSALALINCYESDSDSDNTPNNSEKAIIQEQSKRLPNPFSHMPPQDAEIIDDSSLHDGRIRSFAHERGNWATFVYIPYLFHDGLNSLLTKLMDVEPAINLKPVEDFHISLTKTVTLKYHWIDSFVEDLKDNLAHFRKFTVIFDSLKVYCNDERTRTFLGIEIHQDNQDDLIRAVDALDHCLKEYRLPTFYSNPSFHMSILWCTGDYESQLNKLIDYFNLILQEYIQNSLVENLYIDVQAFYSKIGNKVFRIDLP